MKFIRLPGTGDHSEGGYILLLVLVMAVTTFIALGGMTTLSLDSLAGAKRTMFDDSALNVAEAGIDNATFQINANPSYTGTNTTCPIGTTGENPVTLFSNSLQGKGTYETCVEAGTISHELIVYSLGKVYRTPADTSPISTSEVKAVVEGSQSGGYSIETGPGGLILSNDVTVTNGPVDVGGFITMSNNATIGSANSPVAVSVANDRCPSPADSSYPQVCSSDVNPNPITISNLAHIYGAVTANGQTNTAGMSNTGLVATSGATPPSLPTYDRSGQISAVQNTWTASQASCYGSQTVTWPANVHITGNVTASNNCKIEVGGNAWIDGNLTLSNNAIMITGPTVSVEPHIMIDGSGGMSVNNNASIAENSNNIPMFFITYYSKSDCSPNCTSVTGADLYNSQSITTISLNNNGGASGSSFEAMWTEINVSNGGTIGQIMGQTINMSNNGTLSFNSTTSGGTWAYDVRYYQVIR